MSDRADSIRVIVTGGAGFIGSHVVEAFLAAGYEVAVIDNLRTGHRENINPAARFYQVDIRDAEGLERIFEQEKPVFVSHQAAMADVRGSMQYPDQYADANIIGTIRLLEVARRHSVRKIVFASTGGAIYGNQDVVPTTEDCVAHPLDLYGVTKLSGEHYLYSYRYLYGLDYCALRYGNVYGPRQDTKGEAGVVAIFSGKMLTGEQAVINGDGTQKRDFVFVGDVACANVLASQRGSGIYNIGTGVPTDINTIFRELARLIDYQLPEVHEPAKSGEVMLSCIHPSKAERELGWQPTVTVAEGLAQTVDFFRAQFGSQLSD